jgi:hypothetical protein
VEWVKVETVSSNPSPRPKKRAIVLSSVKVKILYDASIANEQRKMAEMFPHINDIMYKPVYITELNKFPTRVVYYMLILKYVTTTSWLPKTYCTYLILKLNL